MAAKTVTLRKGEGGAYWLLNGRYEVKVSSSESGGAVSVVEITIPEGWGPPEHTHDGAETAYVLDGKIRFHIENQVFEAGPGDVVHIPEGTWERPEPIGTARALFVYMPGGMDEFFAELGTPATAPGLPPLDPTPPDLTPMIEAGARYGLQMRPADAG